MTMDSLDAVRVRGLRKAYGDLQALDGVDLTVARGEVLALLGPNGAGKTTLVEILEGHRRADAGAVSVLGYDPGKRERAFRSRIGIVLQEAGLDPLIKVREAIELYGAAYPHPRPARELLELVGLEDRAEYRAADLSGGQRRRLDLALGLVGDPDLIFLDEPTTGFDPSARRQSWETIANLRSARQVDPADHALHGGGAAARRPRRRARARHASSPRARRTSSGRESDTVVGFRLPRFHETLPLPAGAVVERETRALPHRDADARPRAAARVGRRPRHGARAPDRHPSHARGRLSRPHRRRSSPHDHLLSPAAGSRAAS